MILHELGRKGVDSGTGDSAVHDLSDGFRQFVCDAEVCAGAGQLVGEGGFLEAPDIHVCCQLHFCQGTVAFTDADEYVFFAVCLYGGFVFILKMQISAVIAV